MRLLALAVLALCLLPAAGLVGRPVRSKKVLSAFQRLHPCPSTGKTAGPCPGYVKDHIVPLACGGPDTVCNLQWQTVAAAKAKDRAERAGCR